MKVSSWKGAMCAGGISGLLVFVSCVIYTHIIFLLTGGESFVTKFETLTEINGIPLLGAQIMGAVVAATVCAVFLRYTSFKFVALYVVSGCVAYIATVFIVFFGAMSYLGLFADGPMNSFDFLFYMLETFPLGAGAGTVIAIVINTIRNNRR